MFTIRVNFAQFDLQDIQFGMITCLWEIISVTGSRATEHEGISHSEQWLQWSFCFNVVVRQITPWRGVLYWILEQIIYFKVIL